MLISSSGGHWIQLLRLRPAFEGHEQVYVTTEPTYSDEVAEGLFYIVPDATRWSKLRLVWLAVKVVCLLVRLRPHVVVTTGAAPGFFAVFFGKMIGSRTIWVDSIANVEKLSMSGKMAGGFADLWLTQWPHLAKPEGPNYSGAVL